MDEKQAEGRGFVFVSIEVRFMSQFTTYSRNVPSITLAPSSHLILRSTDFIPPALQETRQQAVTVANLWQPLPRHLKLRVQLTIQQPC